MAVAVACFLREFGLLLAVAVLLLAPLLLLRFRAVKVEVEVGAAAAAGAGVEVGSIVFALFFRPLSFLSGCFQFFSLSLFLQPDRDVRDLSTPSRELLFAICNSGLLFVEQIQPEANKNQIRIC